MHLLSRALCLSWGLLIPVGAIASSGNPAPIVAAPEGNAAAAVEPVAAPDSMLVFGSDRHEAGPSTWLEPVATAAGHHGEVVLSRPELAETRDLPLEDRARELVRILAEGPTEEERLLAHAKPIFPVGTRIDSVQLTDANVVEIRAEFPRQYLEDLRSGQEAIDSLTHLLSDNIFMLPVSGVMVYALDDESGAFVPLSAHEPEIDWESGPGEPDWGTPPETWYPQESERSRNQYPHPTGGRPTGSLSQRTVYLNAGHGRTWRSSETWGLQRGFVYNNIEDYSNADFVHGWVTAYLLRAGADVFNVREWDPNPNMVIVDNDDDAPDYIESGTWTTSSLAGFENGHIPYVQPENPFSFGSNRLAQCVVGEPTATATWIPTIPEAGFYNVYVSHAAFTNRSPQAHYRVTHAGGESEYYIDQRRHRFTWIFIGRYFFEAGRDPNQGKVVLSNSSSSSEHYVSADAVRFGGGRGIISRGTVGVSPYPNHDNEAVYNLQFMGAPTSVYQSTANPPNDESKGWSGRPLFGRWLEGQSVAYGSPYYPAVFLSNHTNATAAGTARGTISYLSTNTSLGSIHDRFRKAVHNKVVSNLTNDYGGAYTANSNPLRSGAYGENNPSNVNGGTANTVPIFLGEWLFHDNATDMSLYHDPKFRRIMARGIYQGIVDHFAAEVGGPTTYLPEPPRNLRVRVVNPTAAVLQWQAPESNLAKGHGHPATGYKIYQSTHGRGFGMGTAVTNTILPISELTPGETYYFQVTATNAGGESFPTETLAVKLPLDSDADRILIVNGYDKLDIATRVQTQHTGSVLYRQFLDQMNTQDYIVEHAKAIDASGIPVGVDSVEHDAVEAGLVTLANYKAVLWIGGIQAEESSTDPTNDTALKSTTRSLLASYLADGGQLFLSGARIGWDLNRIGQTGYLGNTLRASWVSAGAQSLASGRGNSIFDGVNGIPIGGPNAVYPVFLADAINSANGSIVAMDYGTMGGGFVLDDFEEIGGWRQPGFSGQTNADPSSSFAIINTIKLSGTSSGRLNYVWGSGDFIRLYNQNLPQFPAASSFSIRIFGDNSGNQVRVCLRDSDSDLFVSDWLPLNFVGWQELTWEDIANNPQNGWVINGDGVVTDANVRLDSIHLQKVGAQSSGNIFFDLATYEPLGGSVPEIPPAAVQYDGDSRLVYLGFPFETISDADKRTEVMTRVLDFFQIGVVIPPPPTEEDRLMVY